MIYYDYINTILGFLFLAKKDGKVVRICLYHNKSQEKEFLKFFPEENIKRKSLKHELNKVIDFFECRADEINLPYIIEGVTEFQKKVLKEISKIPFSHTITYKELAKRCGNEKAYRAVANACAKNPLPFIIPCHRVVGSRGIGGFAFGVELKKRLLIYEHPFLLT